MVAVVLKRVMVAPCKPRSNKKADLGKARPALPSGRVVRFVRVPG